MNFKNVFIFFIDQNCFWDKTFDGGLTIAGSQTVDAGGNKILNVGTPVASTDAANKGYVDAVKQALDIKDSVRVATTANIAST